MAELGIVLRSYLPVQLSVELAQEAERRGFHSVWVTESMDAKDAYTQMAAIAMKHGPYPCGLGHHPHLHANSRDGGDEHAGPGRAFEGAGHSGSGHRTPHRCRRGHGVKLDRPLTAMREYVEIVRLLVREREFRYEGQVYNVPRYAGTSRSYFEDHPFRIPIFVAALRSRMARLAGEVADGY